jgi:hypothetical protein
MLDINYFDKTTTNIPYAKFLGLVIDHTLTWNNHIDQFADSTLHITQ